MHCLVKDVSVYFFSFRLMIVVFWVFTNRRSSNSSSKPLYHIKLVNIFSASTLMMMM